LTDYSINRNSWPIVHLLNFFTRKAVDSHRSCGKQYRSSGCWWRHCGASLSVLRLATKLLNDRRLICRQPNLLQ